MQVKDMKKMLEGFNDSDKLLVTDLKHFYQAVELNSDDKGFATLIIE